MNRRSFLIAAAQSAAASLAGAAPSPAKPRIGLVHSSHSRLARPASPEDPLDYERVRDMIWQAIEYAGGLASRIRSGSWVVIKPNIVFLRPQQGYRPGDITDLRVTQAVIEYVAHRSAAARITVAEGGSYRGPRDPARDNVVSQSGQRVDAATFDWGAEEFPGAGGTLDALLRRFRERFPGRGFDYVDLSYDGLRDASGKLRRVDVPKTRRGIGAFGARPDYFISNTIRSCDFLITVPVMKVHDQCGITGCLKNYVGTAPREAYAQPGAFWNAGLHAEHSYDGRIDPFIADLAAFHPPDFSIVDGIRGLQYTEHNNQKSGQMVRSNLVMAGADPVAADALIAHLLGFNPWDIDFLHLAEQREMGMKELAQVDVIGDDPSRLRGRWAKPKDWYGRCNRQWRVTSDPKSPSETWTRLSTRGDTLRLDSIPAVRSAAARVQADGHRKAYLWVGAQGRVAAFLNGREVMRHENLTGYRIGQFQAPVELDSGENQLVFEIAPVQPQPAQLSVLLTGPRNDGDTVDGIRWM